jgi:hypothetical protein
MLRANVEHNISSISLSARPAEMLELDAPSERSRIPRCGEHRDAFEGTSGALRDGVLGTLFICFIRVKLWRFGLLWFEVEMLLLR